MFCRANHWNLSAGCKSLVFLKLIWFQISGVFTSKSDPCLNGRWSFSHNWRLNYFVSAESESKLLDLKTYEFVSMFVSLLGAVAWDWFPDIFPSFSSHPQSYCAFHDFGCKRHLQTNAAYLALRCNLTDSLQRINININKAIEST